MHRTIKLPYHVAEEGFHAELADLRRRQSRAIRAAYSRLCDGVPVRQIYQVLRAHPVGQGLHTWLLLSGMSKAKALQSLRPDGKVVFGGKKALRDRSQGKLTAKEWKARRLWPLIIEGHARSYGSQGGNHLVTLDAAQRRLIFHAPSGKDYPLLLKLSGRSKAYRRRLEQLQFRCEDLRDTPFSVSVSEREVRISWNQPVAKSAPAMERERVLSLDLNPTKIGWTVVEKAMDSQCRCVAWGVFDYPTLSRRLGLASNHPRKEALNRKRRHELAIMAKKTAEIARHYGASVIVTERLNFGAADRGKGRRFNRLVNQCWFKRGFLLPLMRRIEESGLQHAEVNPAYSSMIGNKFWADSLNIPDPACAALEVGRRFLYPLKFAPATRNPLPKSNAGRQRKDGRRTSEKSDALGGWNRVWRNLNPRARDTPRPVRRSWREPLRFGPPRRPSVGEQRSGVLSIDPRSGASESFAFDFNQLLAG